MGKLGLLFMFLLSFMGAAEREGPVFPDKQQAKIADLLKEFEFVEELVEKWVSMQGELVFKMFPRETEDSPVEEGDAVAPCWLLRIEPSQEEIALCLGDDLRSFCAKHVGKRVSVEGALFPAHTSHHPTRVLIDVQKMELHHD